MKRGRYELGELRTLEGWKEERILREAASVYERRASESLQRLRAASNELEAKKASRIWQAVANALELAEMALEGGATV
jgi:hypothetical protein